MAPVMTAAARPPDQAGWSSGGERHEPSPRTARCGDSADAASPERTPGPAPQAALRPRSHCSRHAGQGQAQRNPSAGGTGTRGARCVTATPPTGPWKPTECVAETLGTGTRLGRRPGDDESGAEAGGRGSSPGNRAAKGKKSKGELEPEKPGKDAAMQPAASTVECTSPGWQEGAPGLTAGPVPKLTRQMRTA